MVISRKAAKIKTKGAKGCLNFLCAFAILHVSARNIFKF